MSDVLLFAIAGGAGGLVWVGVTTAATAAITALEDALTSVDEATESLQEVIGE